MTGHKAKLKRAKRVAGIEQTANALGVTRFHLWRVLSGRRKSESLMIRYRKFQEGQTPGPKKEKPNL